MWDSGVTLRIEMNISQCPAYGWDLQPKDLVIFFVNKTEFRTEFQGIHTFEVRKKKNQERRSEGRTLT